MEYQYDETETETFYVDVDLSSLNGIAKPSKPRKTLRQSSDIGKKAFNGAGLGVFDIQDHQPKSTPSRKPKRARKNESNFQEGPTSLQMLELDSINPFVSYRDQIYSCNWTDMVGTNMYFEPPSTNAALRTSSPSIDHGLIGTSRIKLLGHRAKLSSIDVKKRLAEGNVDTANGHQPSNVPSSKLQLNPEAKKQARFLERLSEVKRRRLETEQEPTSAQGVNSALPPEEFIASHT